jgi:4-diphosphocytidyl-2-C-methyl-D-erythritol kinase
MPNGYHAVDGLVMFVKDLYDELIVEESHEDELVIEGKFREQLIGPNILDKVLAEFSFARTDKFKITLIKNIPIAAGLGGGSSNAFELIWFLIKKYNLHLTEKEIIELCLKIGADVPMFYYKQAAYISGVGEVMSLAKVPKVWVVIVYPKILLLSRDIYNMGFKRYKQQMPHQSFADVSSFISYLSNTTNDLFENAVPIAPMLTEVIDAIRSIDGCQLVRMSGSGSSCFGIFTQAKEASDAAQTLSKMLPEYFICSSLLI